MALNFANFNPIVRTWGAISAYFSRREGPQNNEFSRGVRVSTKTSLPAVNSDDALTLSAVWACVNLIANTASIMPFYAVKNGRRVSLPVVDLLNSRPNPDQTRVNLMHTLVTNLVLFGNAYVLFGPTRSFTGKISILPSAQVRVELDANNKKVFVFTDIRGNQTRYTSLDVIHIMMPSVNGVMGLPAGYFSSLAMGVSMATERRVGVMASKGFRSTGYFTSEFNLTEEQREQLRAASKSVQDGDDDSLILEANLGFTPNSTTPKDAQFLETRQYNLAEICRYFNVPPALIHSMEQTASWASGIEAIRDGFYLTNILPLAENIEAAFTAAFAGNSGAQIRMDARPFLRLNPEQNANVQAREIQSGILTINEARMDNDRPPIVTNPTNPGDMPFLQIQYQPVHLIYEEAEKRVRNEDNTGNGEQDAASPEISPVERPTLD